MKALKLRTPESDQARLKSGREKWRALARTSMHSAVWEYTPITEFEALMDYIDELEETVEGLKTKNK